LKNIDFEIMSRSPKIAKLRLLNAYYLMKAYMLAGDFERVQRFLSENTEANLFIKDLLDRLVQESSLYDAQI
jgi:hypothetical protein